MSDLQITICKRYYIPEDVVVYIEDYTGKSISNLSDTEICEIVDEITKDWDHQTLLSEKHEYTFVKEDASVI